MGKFKSRLATLAIFFVVIVCAFLSSNVIKSISSKDVSVMYKDKTFLLGGDSVGIKLLAQGVLVMKVDRDDIDLKVGDIILEVNSNKVNTSAALEEIVKNSGGKEVTLKITRQGENKILSVLPVYDSASDTYKMSVWVKDSTAGVGTITFYDKDMLLFAGLGHGITETEENYIVPIEMGAITSTDIYSIKKGYANDPRWSKRNYYK